MKKCLNCGRGNAVKYDVLCRKCVKALDKLPAPFKGDILKQAKHFEALLNKVASVATVKWKDK